MHRNPDPHWLDPHLGSGPFSVILGVTAHLCAFGHYRTKVPNNGDSELSKPFKHAWYLIISIPSIAPTFSSIVRVVDDIPSSLGVSAQTLDGRSVYLPVDHFTWFALYDFRFAAACVAFPALSDEPTLSYNRLEISEQPTIMDGPQTVAALGIVHATPCAIGSDNLLLGMDYLVTDVSVAGRCQIRLGQVLELSGPDDTILKQYTVSLNVLDDQYADYYYSTTFRMSNNPNVCSDSRFLRIDRLTLVGIAGRA